MRNNTQAGMAMVIVIWVLSLLTIMAGSFALTMRRETTVVSAIKDNAVALAAAETGLAIAQQRLLLRDEGKRWHADGSVYQVQYQDAEIRVRLFSEQGKIDINKADEALLRLMMESTTINMDKQQELVSAILDWRDPDDFVHINGAEKQQYDDAGLAYQPANKEFQLVDELQMVLGMNADIYQQLKPLITVYSGQAKVDLQVASKEVLQAVGNMDSVMLDDYLLQRTENNQAQFITETTAPISAGRGNSKLKAKAVYTVISQARIFGEVSTGIKVTIKKTSAGGLANPFQVLDWQQLYQELSLFSEEIEQQLITEQDESEQ
ncbi:MAG: general secretion pathway protein GspK [Methylococcaceae bacterium]|nr:general secretion pathway protein GspK [Methylococcaceae bacterium]